MSTPPPATPHDGGTSGRARASRWWGSLAAVVAAAAALAVAELVAGVVRNATSPVLSVGEWVIDHSPSWLKEFAVSRFGTNDKVLLIAGTVVLLTIFAVGIGWVASRHRWAGVAGIVIFGLIGAATAASRPSATPAAVLPALIGSAVAVAVLVFLLRRLEPAPSPTGTTEPVPGDLVPVGAPQPPAPAPASAPTPSASGPAVMTPTRIPAAVGPVPAGFDRRRFLTSAVAVGGGAVVVAATGRGLQRRFDVDTTRSAIRLPAPGSPAAPLPPGVDLGAAGVTPFMTANADFYRVDTALQAPQVATEGWTLRVAGMVDRPLTLSFQDLLDRPLVERTITLVCVSNEVGGSYAGTARWLGVPLADLLREAGIQPASTQLVSRSIDGWTAGTPTAAVLDGRDALVAIGMNGEPLPVEHGFPARLVVPGLYGFTSATKWLTEIEATTFEAYDAYWVQRGWARQAPIKTFTRIDTPRGLATVPAGPTAIGGVAWAVHRGIEQVEVRIDEGPWQQATLGEVPSGDTWRQWMLPWQATPGSHTIAARATDGDGILQTEDRAAPIPDGASGWHSIVALVS